jgi:hypothetical protein
MCDGRLTNKAHRYEEEDAMPKLPKYTLEKNEKRDRWDLTNDTTDRVVKSFETKDEATKGGVLEKAVGSEGGSVKIQKENGRFQEERTYPGSKDPSKSPG